MKKYKIYSSMKNKNLVGDIIQVKKIKSKGGQVRPTTKKQKSTRDLLIEFMGEQREFNTRIEKDIANLKNDVSSLKKTQVQQNKHLQRIDSRLDRQDERFQRIDSRLDRQDERFENIEHELSI